MTYQSSYKFFYQAFLQLVLHDLEPTNVYIILYLPI